MGSPVSITLSPCAGQGAADGTASLLRRQDASVQAVTARSGALPLLLCTLFTSRGSPCEGQPVSLYSTGRRTMTCGRGDIATRHQQGTHDASETTLQRQWMQQRLSCHTSRPVVSSQTLHRRLVSRIAALKFSRLRRWYSIVPAQAPNNPKRRVVGRRNRQIQHRKLQRQPAAGKLRRTPGQVYTCAGDARL